VGAAAIKLLILGGSVFLGRHIVEQALAAGHEVTLFNRGQTNPELFDGEVEKVHGDRATDLGKLKGKTFDACIDPSGYLPAQLDTAGKVLGDQVDRYVFISSISVYPEFTAPNMDEHSPLSQLPDGVADTVYDQQYYGAFKVLCEQAIEAQMPGRVLQVRSGLIVGPYDPTNRFTYWPVRLAKGGEVLCPESPSFPVQIIHAADQARWILHMLETDQMGTFNVTSDNGTYTMGDLVTAAETVTGADIRPVYASSEFLLENKVAPWMELPLWLPDDYINMSRTSASKAVAAGLELIPLTEVIRSTLEWYNSIPEQDWPAGLAPEKEQQLLKLLK
jgi:2'-hydroxyisoflavone reductase